MIEVNKLIPHERNIEFFDDITGDNWTEFKKSIETSGVIEPVVVTQNYIIVSGHQRVRACIELCKSEVPCEVKIYDSEELIIKDLLETNLRQRGIGNTNAIKFARCIAELERIYDIRNGGNRKSERDNLVLKSQSDLANELGFSNKQLQDYKKLLNLIPELQDLIEKDQISPTIGYKVLSKLSKTEQEQLIADFGKDYISSLTQIKAQELIKEFKKKEDDLLREKKQLEEKIQQQQALEQEIETLKKQFKERPEKEPEDYQKVKNELKDNKKYYDNLKKDYDKKVELLNDLQSQIKAMTELKPEEQYSKKLKDDAVLFCAKVENFISQVGGLAYLANHINDLPKNEQKAYIKTIELVESWAYNIKVNLEQYL